MLDSVWDRVKQQHADWIQKKYRFRLWDKNRDEYCKGYFNDKKQSLSTVRNQHTQWDDEMRKDV